METLKFPVPDRWDMETDLVAIGSGIGGLSAAITANEYGIEAVVLERSALVGGVTAYSFGELWVAGNHLAEAAGLSDSAEAGLGYMRWLSAGFGDERLIRSQAVHGPIALKFFEENAGVRWSLIRDFSDYLWPQCADGVPEGRFIEVEPFPAASLGDWQSRVRVSPHVPYGMSHKDMFGAGGIANFANWDFGVMAGRLAQDERCLGPGLAAYFVKAALDRDIPLLTETDVVGLIQDDEGRVVGVASRRDGQDYFVRARRGVVIATSGYDGNQGFEKRLSQHVDVHSMLGPEIDGAHLRLAGRLGAQVARVPDVSMLGYSIPGEEIEDGRPLWRNTLTEMGLPHALVVNRAGRRFGDESFYRTLAFAVDYFDGSNQSQPNFPCWIIQDAQSRAKYPFGSIMPGQDLPDGLAVKADTLAELATRTGIDPEGLVAEVDRFNGYCEAGVDPDFHRGEKPWAKYMCGDVNNKPNPNLGPVAQAPFYAIRLERVSGGGISSTGLLIDEHCRVIDYDDRPIPGVYAVGGSSARLDQGAGSQSGFSNTRGMTQGWLSARHAAGKPSEELA
ncbi:FAD-binding protein [Mycobacterium sp.]|uniref:FAD-binding protein n=1 Tax=Mycobacterium sp. TaxID=1785 RepID=UPI002DA340F2|nr:FAD-binding protein [Mycobacterium sp.]